MTQAFLRWLELCCRDRRYTWQALSNPEKASGTLLPYRDTILLPKSDKPSYQSFSVRTARAGMSMSVPFAPRSIHYLDRVGNVWHGHGSEFRIFRSTLAGDTTLEITVAATPTPVTPEELREWESGQSVKEFRDMGGKLDMGRIPNTKPHFERFYVDPEGFLWVSIPSVPNETVFGVFDQRPLPRQATTSGDPYGPVGSAGRAQLQNGP